MASIHMDNWKVYIDKNLFRNLTVEDLAIKFGYSVQHFRHVFSYYFGITPSDYIRKQRLHIAAKKIREGEDVAKVAKSYGFSSYQGFARAFKKEFHVSLSQYRKAKFEIVNLNKYYSEYKDFIHVSYMELDKIKAMCRPVIPDVRKDVDIPAQLDYWVNHEFPCVKDVRLNYNKQIKEDKVSLWYQVEDGGETFYQYLLGEVVEKFDKDHDFNVTIAGGKYAVFQTDKPSDRENIADTIRMFARCVYYGWVQENKEKVDFTRYTFERYLNDKVMAYVPMK